MLPAVNERDRELSDMDPAGRFSDRAADYRRHRPDYPAAAIDWMLEGLGDPAALTAADVGAGTGISSRQLAGRGVSVLAIEPNVEMSVAAEPAARVRWRTGTAEATGLGPASVGLVLCAQSFHWFRAREALEEFHRILAPGGRLVLLWNSRDRDDPLTRAYIEAIHEVNGEHPAELRPFDRGVLEASGLFSPPEERSVPHEQRLDAAGLLGRATSASYVPRSGPAFEQLEVLLRDLWVRHRDGGGMVTMRYRTIVYRSRRLTARAALSRPGS